MTTTYVEWRPVDSTTPEDQLPPLDQPVLVSRHRAPGGRKPFDYVDTDYRGKRFYGRWACTDGFEHITAWAEKPVPYGQPEPADVAALRAHLAAHYAGARPADGGLFAWALAALSK